MKSLKSALTLILIIVIIGITGCTSENNYSNNTGPISDYNNTSNSQNSSNNYSSSNSTAPNYEASGYCYYVVDGDTIDVQGVGRIRFVGVNTPERGQPGYQEAKDFVKSMCLGKTVGLDIDDAKHYDKYGRTLAVVYAGNTNVNAELLKRGYAEVMYIPPSEFDPYSWAGNTNYQIKKSNSNSASANYYIGNKRSMKFHRPDCISVRKMSESNKVRLNSRHEAVSKGYISCRYCNP